MKSKKFFARRGERGFIKAVIVIVIALLVLAYFGFDLEDHVDQDTFKSALEAVKSGFLWTWQHIIKTPALWIWNEIIIDIVWEKFLTAIIEKVKS